MHRIVCSDEATIIRLCKKFCFLIPIHFSYNEYLVHRSFSYLCDWFEITLLCKLLMNKQCKPHCLKEFTLLIKS